MKNYTLIIVYFILVSLNAQTTPFSETLSGPKGMVIFNDGTGDYLYVAESGNGAGTGQIVRLNLSATPDVAKEVVITGLNRPFGLSLNGSTLYIVDSGLGNGSGVPGQILSYDLSSVTGTPGLTSTIYNFPFDSDSPRGILYDSGNLYVSEVESNDIFAIDLSLPIPSNLDVFCDLDALGAGPVGLVVNGTTMYAAGRDSNIIYEISNINTYTPGSSLSATSFIDFDSALGDWIGPEFLYLDGSTLYISGRDGNEIGSVDIGISNPLSSGSIIVTSNSPEQVIPFNNNLYIAENDKVSFFVLPTLSASTSLNKSSFVASPNPTKDVLTISGFDGEKEFQLYNLLGRIVMKGIVNQNETINIDFLDSGIYLLKFDEDNVLKIIKE